MCTERQRRAEGASGLNGAALHLAHTHSCRFLFSLFSCTQLLNHKRNSKIQFFALLTLGSIVRTHARHHAKTCALLANWLDELRFLSCSSHRVVVFAVSRWQAYASPAARDLLRSTFSEPFTAFIQQATQSDNAALKQVANDCKLLYQL